MKENSNMELVCQEDNLAPDAKITFAMDMDRECGLNYSDFFASKSMERSDDGRVTQYTLRDYTLECSSDDPYYKLYKNG